LIGSYLRYLMMVETKCFIKMWIGDFFRWKMIIWPKNSQFPINKKYVIKSIPENKQKCRTNNATCVLKKNKNIYLFICLCGFFNYWWQTILYNWEAHYNCSFCHQLRKKVFWQFTDNVDVKWPDNLFCSDIF